MGIEKPFQWHEFNDIDPNTVILDVREPMEREMGFITNSINIPVDQLRARMVELDKSKTYVVYCAVGIRGHAALESSFKTDLITSITSSEAMRHMRLCFANQMVKHVEE